MSADEMDINDVIGVPGPAPSSPVNLRQIMEQMAAMKSSYDEMKRHVERCEADVRRERASRLELEQRLREPLNPPAAQPQPPVHVLPPPHFVQMPQPTTTPNSLQLPPSHSMYMPSSASAATTSALPPAAPIMPATSVHSSASVVSQGGASTTSGATSWNGPPRSAGITQATLTHKPFELPAFDGRPEHWPLFISAYRQSTEAFGYGPLQNIFRLQRSLHGEAIEAVRSLLMNPDNLDTLLSTLEFRFGRPELLVQDQIARIREVIPINEHQYEMLIPFASRVQNLAAFLNTDASRHVLTETSLLAELVSKLPISRQIEWAQHSARILPRPSAIDFAAWLHTLAQYVSMISTGPTPQAASMAQRTTGGRSQRGEKRVLLNVAERTRNVVCIICDNTHKLFDCPRFRRMSVTERWTLARRNQLCFGCLRSGHSFENCRSKRECTAADCDRWHHYTLHAESDRRPSAESDRRPPADSDRRPQADTTRRTAESQDAQQQRATSEAAPSGNSEVAANRSNASNPFGRPHANAGAHVYTCRDGREEYAVLFRIIPVVLYGLGSRVNTYALLDEGSSVTIIDADIASSLKLSGPASSLSLQGVSNTTSTETSHILSLQISGADPNARRYHMQGVRTMRDLNLPMQSMVLSQLDHQHQHLRGLPASEYRHATPKILIGLDNGHLGVARQVRTGTHGGPIAAKTRLGWVVYGRQSTQHERALHCCEQNADYTRLAQIVQQFNSTESFGVKAPERLLESDENIRARSILESTTVRIADRYQTGLLWRADDTQLPDSYEMALQRLASVERKMQREPEYAALYAQQIEAYVGKGHARKLTAEEANIRDGRTWYLPHFGVTSIHKPGKLRIVFDAAAKAHGTSLNDALSKGPDLNKPLAGILFLFRMGRVGVCGDIADMFHQVVMQPCDRKAQRFLWRTGAGAQPDVFETTVMTFGATCSPTSAQFVKNMNASMYEAEYPAAAAAIKNLHYVDDFVASFTCEEEAATVTRDVIMIHRHGGFVLRGFVSNSRAVLEELGEMRESSPQMDLQLDSKGADKILGMRWDTASDAFVFAMRFERVDADVIAGRRWPTKRELLSITMSVFDPFGFLADFMVNMKLLLQELWRTGTSWDETIPEPIFNKWQAWIRAAEPIKQLRIPRCYSAHMFTSVDTQLHIFADASEEAFAAVAYWRIVHEGGIDVTFVTAKTRCAPLKLLSVPRLELQAAVLAVRLGQIIAESHNVRASKTVMWTDSRTVLGWIQSAGRRFKPFVAHRVGEILDGSPAASWRWIPTLLNVADDATRRKECPRFDANSRWLRGPEFLSSDEASWPIIPPTREPENELEEEICPRFVGVLNADRVVAFDQFSSYTRLRRMFGRVLRFYNNARACTTPQARTSGELTVAELDAATHVLCRVAQAEGFPAEYAALTSGQSIDRSSSIRTLLPYTDDERVMRLYGRTDAADARYLPESAKRPILLPTNHHLTELIVRFHHFKMGHQFEDGTICAIRQMFWVPNLRKLVRGVKSRCNVCKFRAALPQPPVAGQLPEDRLTPYVYAFEYTGLDYFGPVIVTVGRRNEKRWIALFTCLTTRAVHMEVAEDLSTDACLVCIRNFINIRGVPKRIRSDCGTNFVGADNEIRRTADFFDMAAIERELSTRGVQWLFNCPANPEAGGVWERLVQSAKRVLAVTLKIVKPRVETLRSFVIEAANIMNSRPLTHLPVSPADLEPITPNHFLLGRANSTGTPGLIDPRQLCQRKQWRICQQLRHQFWARWLRDYLPELTRRTKFYKEVGPIKVGDLVLICDANQARGEWRRGRVERVTTGPDGIVRSAEVRTSDSLMRRPVSKLAVLDVEPDETSETG